MPGISFSKVSEGDLKDNHDKKQSVTELNKLNSLSIISSKSGILSQVKPQVANSMMKDESSSKEESGNQILSKLKKSLGITISKSSVSSEQTDERGSKTVNHDQQQAALLPLSIEYEVQSVNSKISMDKENMVQISYNVLEDLDNIEFILEEEIPWEPSDGYNTSSSSKFDVPLSNSINNFNEIQFDDNIDDLLKD